MIYQYCNHFLPYLDEDPNPQVGLPPAVQVAESDQKPVLDAPQIIPGQDGNHGDIYEQKVSNCTNPAIGFFNQCCISKLVLWGGEVNLKKISKKQT